MKVTAKKLAIAAGLALSLVGFAYADNQQQPAAATVAQDSAQPAAPATVVANAEEAAKSGEEAKSAEGAASASSESH